MSRSSRSQMFSVFPFSNTCLESLFNKVAGLKLPGGLQLYIATFLWNTFGGCFYMSYKKYFAKKSNITVEMTKEIESCDVTSLVQI